MHNIAAKNCSIIIIGIPIVNAGLSVLCRNRYMAQSAPMEPPIKASPSNVETRILVLPCIALHLSIPYRMKVIMLIVNKYIIPQKPFSYNDFKYSSTFKY